MSACISRHGEFSSHTPGGRPFTCAQCGIFDEKAALDQAARDAETIAGLRAEVEMLQGACSEAIAAAQSALSDGRKLLQIATRRGADAPEATR